MLVCGPRLSRADIEDRKGCPERKDNRPPDRTLSIGTHWRIGEATPSARTAVCFGLEGSNARGCGSGSVPERLRGSWRRNRALLAVHTRVDGSGARSRDDLNWFGT